MGITNGHLKSNTRTLVTFRISEERYDCIY
jgi:hypothetical protein